MLKIDFNGLTEAVFDFFVIGSYIAETSAPVYQANENNPHPARFDQTLEADALLAAALSKQVIFHYGPPLWRLGMTDHYYEFDAGGPSRRRAADKLVAIASSYSVEAGSQLFRIRKNLEADEHVATASAFDPPPSHIIRSFGRWDTAEFPALYVSDDIELCLHECRAAISDEIVVATLVPNRTLKVLDLSQELPLGGGTPFEDPNIFVSIMSRSRGPWLDFCREIAKSAHAAGFDGVRYVSYYSQAKHDTAAVNLSLFGNPIAAGLLTVQSVNRLSISDARYDFRLGPVLYKDAEMRAELADAEAAWAHAAAEGAET